MMMMMETEMKTMMLHPAAVDKAILALLLL
jgi:hypothetical protein